MSPETRDAGLLSGEFLVVNRDRIVASRDSIAIIWISVAVERDERAVRRDMRVAIWNGGAVRRMDVVGLRQRRAYCESKRMIRDFEPVPRV